MRYFGINHFLTKFGIKPLENKYSKTKRAGEKGRRATPTVRNPFVEQTKKMIFFFKRNDFFFQRK